jgi:hypothetical protein
VRCKCALAGGGRKNRILGALKGDEERIALVVDLPPAKGGERFPQQAVVVLQDGRVLVAVQLQESRRALDVREEKRCCG